MLQEEADYLESRLPFVCQHEVVLVVRIDSDSISAGNELSTPRSKYQVDKDKY